MKKLLAILYFSFVLCTIYSQQGRVYNLYFHEHYFLNPAAAGNKGLTVFSVAARESWLGFPENTPGNQVISYQTRFNDISFKSKYSRYHKKSKGSVGFGAMIYNDVAGPIRKTGLLTSYAYYIKLRQANISFGLSPFIYQVFTDESLIKMKNAGDPILNRDYFVIADVNVGFYLTSKEYFFSFTSNNLTESKIKTSDNEYFNYRDYILLTGYNLMLNKRLYIQPSFLIQSDENFNSHLDLHIKWTYNKRFWAGFGYSVNNSLNAFVGMISDQMDFGYYFQMPNADVIQYSMGSHEIVFSMKFGQEKLNKYNRYRR